MEKVNDIGDSLSAQLSKFITNLSNRGFPVIGITFKMQS